MRNIGNYFILFLKGVGMGSANVIPGVSGGTIAFITGIFERLINAIKAFDFVALKLVFTGKFKAFAQKTDLWFLFSVFLGIVIAIVTLARVFDFLFTNYPVYIWSYFFGLVLASVYFVGKSIEKWNTGVIISLIIGTAIAVVISFLNPLSPNDSTLYIFICGIIAICSMILPGLSGSFVLLLMGNYQLVAIDAINSLNLRILIPFALGCAIGLIAFSHFLSWIFKTYRDQTIAVLTGFVLGSVSILWPWSSPTYLTNATGDFILKNGEKVILSYHKVLPESMDKEVIFAILIALAGILTIWATEYLAQRKKKDIPAA